MINAAFFVQLSYLIVAILFILGLRAMSSPVTARRGIIQAGIGMGLAVLATFFLPGIHNILLITIALIVGAIISGIAGAKIPMTAMPQGVAAFNGLGGGSAAAIGLFEIYKLTPASVNEYIGASFSALAIIIGSVSFSGSAIAFLKLQGSLRKTLRLPGQNIILVVLTIASVVLGILSSLFGMKDLIVYFLVVAILLGLLSTLPIGGADMPVVISLLNALTGLAVGLEGYAISNAAMIVAGVVVGASGLLLTKLMAKAMNRKIVNVLFKTFTIKSSGDKSVDDGMKEVSALDTASMLRYASSVIIVPGYGMAVAGAQHKVWEMTKVLTELGVLSVSAPARRPRRCRNR